VEKFSKGDFAAITGHFIWGNPLCESLNVIGQIKALNPNIKIIGYVSGKNSTIAWENPNPQYPFAYDWWVRTKPYWSYTTTGDTLQDWAGKVVLNILDPGCREAMVSTIVEYHRNSNNKFDGVFWDYFNKWLWIAPQVQYDGLADMDGDGIEHWVDQDEIAGFQAAQAALATALRDSLGESFIQFFNGQRAYEDSVFCSLSDGILYELFPTLFFPNPDMRNALDPNYQYNLFRVGKWPRSQNGGPYVLLTNLWENWYADHHGEITYLNLGDSYRAVGLLTDCYSVWNRGSTSYGWTENDLNLGEPLGPTLIDGNVYTREFEYGRIELIMISGQYPNPYDYTIWVHGNMAEALDIPFHYP
jgi:hypothetical protein